MIANRTDGFDERLARAISADDPDDALHALRRRARTDPELDGQVRAALELIDELSALRERIDRAALPPLALPPLAKTGWKRRWLAPAPAAAAVAAAVIVAVGLLSVSPPAQPVGGPASPAEPVAVTVDWDVPDVQPVSLADQELSVPEITMPSLASMEVAWSIPSLEMPSTSDTEDTNDSGATTAPASSFHRSRRQEPLPLKDA